MTFIDLETRWFEIAEIPIIDQSSARIYQIFNRVWLSRYTRPCKVIFNNGSEFKRNFIPFIKYFSFKQICTENAILEKIHQVVGSMHNTKDIANVTFGAVPPWSNILEYIVYAVR